MTFKGKRCRDAQKQLLQFWVAAGSLRFASRLTSKLIFLESVVAWSLVWRLEASSDCPQTDQPATDGVYSILSILFDNISKLTALAKAKCVDVFCILVLEYISSQTKSFSNCDLREIRCTLEACKYLLEQEKQRRLADPPSTSFAQTESISEFDKDDLSTSSCWSSGSSPEEESTDEVESVDNILRPGVLVPNASVESEKVAEP
mmetsp:Transcript_28132/g.45165  ORF Transcript_28132/g.45165 Transcript_28132/m.45165 type:complete len:204 (-) Transcript_28132:54-665(-)